MAFFTARMTGWIADLRRADRETHPRETAKSRRSAISGRGARPAAPTSGKAVYEAAGEDTYLLSLGSIRKRLGDHWQTLEPSVHRIAQSYLMRAMGDDGFVDRQDDAYALIFRRIRGSEVRARGRRIEKDLLELFFRGKGADSFLRESAAAGRSVRGGNRRVNPIRRFLNALTHPFRTIKDALRRDSRDGARKAVADIEAGDGAPATDARRKAREDAFDAAPGKTARARTARGGGGGRPRMSVSDDLDLRDGMSEARNRSIDALGLQTLRRESRAIENAMIADLLKRFHEWEEGMQGHAFPPPELRFIYRSMWNLESEHLTTYTSVPVCWKSSLEVLYGENVLPRRPRPETMLILDRMCLQNTIDVLTRFVDEKQPVLFMNRVHAATLCDDELWKKYSETAGELPEAARRQVIMEIIGAEDVAHSPKAFEMVRRVRNLSRAVTVCIGLQSRNLAFWKECGVMGVGADLSLDDRDEARIVADLAGFASQARLEKLTSYLREVDRSSLALSALTSGIGFIEGSVIGSSDEPDNLVLSRFDVENMYEMPVRIGWSEEETG